VSFAAVFVAFFACHHVGDYLLQTEWQAVNKSGGLARGAEEARRALVSHVSVYTLAFVPALVWLATETGAAVAAVLAALIFVPHLVVDDGRLLDGYLRRVKGVEPPVDDALSTAVDQSVHVVSLFAVALLAAAAT
jgi:hypothetical protein